MLSASEIGHFHSFGFVMLRGLLGPEQAATLRTEVESALHDAYAATYDERVIDGIGGHYLPMASKLTPMSASLICDDPTFIDAAEQLLGGPALPSVPEGILFFAEAGWHNDDGIGVRGVKFITYFDELDATNGALRIVPCSHASDVQAALRAYQRAGSTQYPAVVVDSRLGDVLAFDVHAFHASFGGNDRLAWAIEYLAEPGNDDERDRTLRWMADSFEQAARGFDRERYPLWRDWRINPSRHPRRAQIIERLQAANVLELPGADLGW